MWNIKYGSKTYEKYYSFKSHKEHIERLVLVKPIIDTRTPKHPSFLHNTKIKKCIEREKHLKSDYDNKNLYGKMTEIDRHYSLYSKQRTVPIFTFSSVKSHFKDKTIQKNIEHENLKMHSRLYSAKTTYSNNHLRERYKHNRYLHYQIKNCVPNPRMNYATLSQFNRNLSFHMKRKKIHSPIKYPNRLLTSNGIRSNYTPFLITQNDRYTYTCYD